ncbi:MAG: copper resistance protein B [Gammaproteobacteria bacterium]|jgi:copper resistance protein B
MKTNIKMASLILAMLPAGSFAAELSDDPILTFFKADQLELRDTNAGTALVWEVDAWLGQDLNKFWVKSSGERVNGETESSEIDLLYGKAILPFWDVQFGLRHELKPDSSENSLGVGLLGLAPYLFEVDANVFVNDDDLFNARISAEYEYLFSQKLILIPNFEMSLYSDDDVPRGIGTGLSNAEIGLRLHYQPIREISPYIGINYERKFGKTADLSSAEGESTNDTQLLTGVSFWF